MISPCDSLNQTTTLRTGDEFGVTKRNHEHSNEALDESILFLLHMQSPFYDDKHSWHLGRAMFSIPTIASHFPSDRVCYYLR